MAGRAKRAGKAVGRAGLMVGGGILGRAKRQAMSVGAGAASELAVEFAAEHSDTVKNKWWGGPGLKFAGALAFKTPSIAHALAGAAGAEAAFNYKLKQFQDGKAEHSPVRDFSEKANEEKKPAGNTSGREEPGDDTSMLFGAN